MIYDSGDGCIVLYICFLCFSHPESSCVRNVFLPPAGDFRIFYCIFFFPRVFRSCSSTPSVTHGSRICYAGSRDQVGVCQSQSRSFTLVSRPAVSPPPQVCATSLCLCLSHTHTHSNNTQASSVLSILQPAPTLMWFLPARWPWQADFASCRAAVSHEGAAARARHEIKETEALWNKTTHTHTHDCICTWPLIGSRGDTTQMRPHKLWWGPCLGSTWRLEAEQQQHRWNTAENSVFLGKGQRSRRRSDTEDEREAGDITRQLLVADSLTLIIVWNSIPPRQLCLTSPHLHVDISTCDIFQQSPSDLSHLNLSSHLRACLFAVTQSVFGRANSSYIQLNYHLCLANGLALLPTSLVSSTFL